MDGASTDDHAFGLMEPLWAAPVTAAVLTDFDGTLSPIVADPGLARALPGAPDVLRRLAEKFAAVAVVSGRPVTFLARQLAAAGPAVRLYGVYGLEWWDEGEVHVVPEAEPWVARAAEVVAAAVGQAPPGVGVEAKGAALAIHWRRAPEAGAWAQAFAEDWAERTGLLLQPGRRALELRPPLSIDKGQVVEAVAGHCSSACFVGDDAGDLPAFAALDRLARRGVDVVRVAVADEESPPELVEAADVVIAGPVEALALLDRIATVAATADG
ncbi:MAG TPA: trehalose-phosphatase [Acidimicrobiales bacterium]|nr:trehalose-phosphatase [Acidimicrobiales bacterium]